MIHSKLNRELTVNLREVIAMYRRGIHLIFSDIDYIQGGILLKGGKLPVKL